MTIKDIIDQFGDLKITENRGVDEDEAEFVVFNEEIFEWKTIIASNLGPPFKPEGKKPNADDLALTKEYGGISSNQILYKRDFDGYTILAMFWPWGDQIQTTLKIARINH